MKKKTWTHVTSEGGEEEERGESENLNDKNVDDPVSAEGNEKDVGTEEEAEEESEEGEAVEEDEEEEYILDLEDDSNNMGNEDELYHEPWAERHDTLIHSHDWKLGKIVNEGDKEYRKTYDEVFNESTLKTIYRLFQRKVLLTVEHPISTGKEANVFLGLDMEKKPVAVKIFRESTSTFRKIRPYIEGDPRFKNIMKGRRGMVAIWAKKEFKNLKRMEHAGVRVPKALGIDRNVLVMEYVGDEVMPAPIMRSWWLENRDGQSIGSGRNDPSAVKKMEGFYHDIKKQMKLIHQDAGLVHSDLSEFNILVHKDKPYVIDVGQAVVHSHPMSGEFLQRDIKNITAFFRKIGVDADERELTEYINAK